VARLIGLDVGNKRIGVAVSDELGILATPRGAIMRRSYNRDAAAIRELVESSQAERIVVGLPLGLSGALTEQTVRTQRFAAMLAERVDVPVEMWDERLTTVMARAVTPAGPEARRAGLVDAAAAAFILQDYLDHRASSQEPSSLLP
jgi:putative Holliday junction resolvase